MKIYTVLQIARGGMCLELRMGTYCDIELILNVWRYEDRGNIGRGKR